MKHSYPTLTSHNTECGSIKSAEYLFADGKCYKDGKDFGDIISQDDNEIVVKVNNGNKYMTGQIQKFIRVSSCSAMMPVYKL